MLSIIINLLLFILVIGFLTFIHELGHFLAAKSIGAKVYEFSLGFGPKLFSKKYKGTQYSLRAIPLGGFVKILGDGDPGSNKEEQKLKSSSGNLKNKPRVLQIFVMLSGVCMNIIFAIIFYYIILGSNGWRTNPIYFDIESVPLIGAEKEKFLGYETIEDGSADLAGLPRYGRIEEINGQLVESREFLTDIVSESELVNLLICDDRGVNCDSYDVAVDDEGRIGVYISYGYIIDYSGNTFFSGFSYVVNNLRLISKVFGSMLSVARETGDYSDLSNTVSGPIGIFLLIDNFKSRGIIVFLALVADLSLSLAIMNLLPVPALDGGRVLILLVESIFRRDLNEKVESIIINISMVLLIILVVLVIIKDVVNIDNMRSMFG